MSNICTILADASYDERVNIGGWAAWIVCDGERIKKYDAIKNPVYSPIEAETIAMINGFYLAVKNFPDCKRFIIQSDCLQAMDVLKNNKFKYRNSYNNKLIDKYFNFFFALQPDKSSVEFRHVKAHSGTATKRQYVNNWCDLHAKKSMRIARLKTG